MKRLRFLLVLVLLVGMGGLGSAYIRNQRIRGVPFFRTDFTNIEFVLQKDTAAGLKNRDGRTLITPDSQPVAAVFTALGSWNKISSSAVHFSDFQAGDLPPSNDGIHLITFADTLRTRAMLQGAVAITILSSRLTGELTDTDIIFNPTLTFSTTLEAESFDIQATLTHELGHALGLDHSGVAGATMFAQVARENRALATLTADDIAFAADIYPQSEVMERFGRLEGFVRFPSGEGVRGASVSAFDPTTNTVVGALTGADGRYRIGKVPAGNYLVYAEPLDGPAEPRQLGPAGLQANVSFQTEFLGGRESPETLTVADGESARADIVVSGQAPALNIAGAGSAPFAGRVRSFVGAVIGAGVEFTIEVFGAGLDDPRITKSSLSFLGAPVQIIEGSFQRSTVTFTDGSSFPMIRFRVKASASSPEGLMSLMISSDSESSVLSGGIRVVRPIFLPLPTSEGVVNAASFLQSPLAPGGIFSIFGKHLGPETEQGSVGRFNPLTGRLMTEIGATTVRVNGIAAPLFFARQDQINAQAPFEIAGASTAELVVSYKLVAGEPITVPVAATSPGVFTFPDGTSAIALNQDGTINSAENPAARETVAAIFATGQGAVGPALETGEPAAGAGRLSRVTSEVFASVGGVGSEVVFAGMTPAFVGLLQLNVRVPAEVAPGPQVPLEIDIGGVSTQPGLTLAIQ